MPQVINVFSHNQKKQASNDEYDLKRICEEKPSKDVVRQYLKRRAKQLEFDRDDILMRKEEE